jgi:uncharacterized protein (TIGR02453 family)
MIQQSTIKFLKGLKKNNNKPWFDKNRNAYEDAKKDFENFIQALIDTHSRNDRDIEELEAKKCIFRINRDVRFSKDKSPYKSNFGASMDRGGKKSGYAGYYFQLEPGKSFLAGGIWMPMPDKLKKIRQEIDYCYDEFNRVVNSKKFKAAFGELYDGKEVKLSRVPQGFDKDNPAGEYLKFKSWLVMRDVDDEELASRSLLKKTVDAFMIMQPFISFLNRAIEE